MKLLRILTTVRVKKFTVLPFSLLQCQQGVQDVEEGS